MEWPPTEKGGYDQRVPPGQEKETSEGKGQSFHLLGGKAVRRYPKKIASHKREKKRKGGACSTGKRTVIIDKGRSLPEKSGKVAILSGKSIISKKGDPHRRVAGEKGKNQRHKGKNAPPLSAVEKKKPRRCCLFSGEGTLLISIDSLTRPKKRLGRSARKKKGMISSDERLKR